MASSRNLGTVAAVLVFLLSGCGEGGKPKAEETPAVPVMVVRAQSAPGSEDHRLSGSENMRALAPAWWTQGASQWRVSSCN